MRFISVYKLLLVLVVAVIGPRSNVTALDCDWCCILTLGFSRCFKSGCGTSSNDDKAEVISGEEDKLVDPKDHPQDVKITTQDTDGTTKENDTNKYNVYKRGDTYLYKFNENVKCTMIKCNDKEVWKRESDTESPDSFTYNKTDSAFLLYFGLDYVKFTKDTSSDSWKGGERLPLVKITTEGSDGKSSENDTSKYDTSNPNPDTFEFKFKDGVKCTKVTHLDKDVWTYGTTTSSTTGGGTGSGGTPTTPTSGGTTATPPYPKSIQYNVREIEFTIEFESTSNTYRLNASSGSWEESAGSVLDVAKAMNDDKDSRFTKSQVYRSWHFKINSGVKITQVRCDGKSVWKQDTSKNDDFYKGHPTLVEYTENPPQIDITVNNKIVHGYVTKDGEWIRRPQREVATNAGNYN